MPDVFAHDAVAEIPAIEMPSYRLALANALGTRTNILINTYGHGIGLGDVICTEPSVRYAARYFKNRAKISVCTEHPELFRHIPLAGIHNPRDGDVDTSKFYVLNAINPESSLQHDFLNPMNINCVDAPALIMFHAQLPVQARHVCLEPSAAEIKKVSAYFGRIVVHPGRHWPSKTFPKSWWDEILKGLVAAGHEPVIIGASCADDRRGTVEVETKGCVDLRDKLSVMESVALLQGARVVLTNDSSPLHMAASGSLTSRPAWIGFFATCKHPDHITHWRAGGFGGRMENLAEGGIHEIFDICPNHMEPQRAEFADQGQVRRWLPEPSDVVRWSMEKFYYA